MRDSLDRHAQHIYADICRDAIAALTAQEEPVEGVHIIFDGPPSHESGRFVEVETPDGRSISWGRWEQRGKYWHLIAPQPVDGVVVPMEPENKLWLWKNFVDGRPEYWAFDNPYPTYGGGDPMTLGEPCGYAIFKESTLSPRHVDFSEADVIAAIQRAAAKAAPSATTPQPTDGRASMQAELGAALGSALSHYKSGDMQACAASLVRIVDLFRDAAKEPRQTAGMRHHSDDDAVDLFAAAMKAKLAVKRAQGRSGWDDPEQCSISDLERMLDEHYAREDQHIDCANFLMMIWFRKNFIDKEPRK